MDEKFLKERAHEKVLYLKKNPHDYKDVAKQILGIKNDERILTQAEVGKVLDFMEVELGNFGIRQDSLDNTATLTLMQLLHKEIEELQKEGENN